MRISHVFRVVFYAFSLLLVASFADAEGLEFDDVGSFSDGLAAVEVDYLRQKNSQLQKELSDQAKRHDDHSMRQDAIVMKLSTTIEDQQLQLQQFKNKNFLQKVAELFSFN